MFTLPASNSKQIVFTKNISLAQHGICLQFQHYNFYRTNHKMERCYKNNVLICLNKSVSITWMYTTDLSNIKKSSILYLPRITRIQQNKLNYSLDIVSFPQTVNMTASSAKMLYIC